MAVGRETVAGEMDVVADALWAIAVVAHTVQFAGGVAAQTGRVDGRCNVAGTGKGGLEGGSHFVKPNDMNHVVRPPGDSGDAVAATVDVDDDTILSDGVGAGEEIVNIHRVEVALALFLVGYGLVAVNDLVIAAVDEFLGKSHLSDGLRTAPGDAASFGHE